MPWYLWLVVAAAVALAAASVLLVVSRRRAPQTPEERLRAARAAARSIRHDSPRPNRDVFQRGRGVPDRHSGAIAENSAYGDAANFDFGSSSSSAAAD